MKNKFQKITKRCYESFLNSLSPDYVSDDWIIGGKNRNIFAALVAITREKSEKRNTLFSNLDRFNKTRDQLNSVKKEQGSDFDPDMDSLDLRLSFESYQGDTIRISNNELCREFVDVLLSKIDEKIENIESDLLTV